MTPALAPFYARWLRIEEAKLFAEIAMAGLDPDEAWEVFRAERDNRFSTAIEAATTREGESDAKSAHRPAEYPGLIDRRRRHGCRTGESTSPPPQKHLDTTPAESAAGEISAPIQESERSSKPAVALPAGSGTDEIPATIPTPLMARKITLRPLCQRPANCGGYGSTTCHACLVAARETAAA